MTDKAPVIFLSAAEASGDEHGARVVESLRRRLPNARLMGVAGPRMAAAGCEVVVDLTAKASMLGGPLLNLRYYLRMLRTIRRSIAQNRPSLIIPIDSPALNWHVSAAGRKVGARVLYYISPQVWAWAPWRVRKLARLTDRVACILPFEETYLRHRGVNATYVGHPLIESLPPRPRPLPDLAQAWADGTWKVALLPGSRTGEIKDHSKALQTAARIFLRRWPKARCTFAARTVESAQAIAALIGPQSGEGISIVVDKTREVLAESHFAIAASGTVTLEVAYFGVPMVIIYRTSRWVGMLHRLLGSWGVPIRHFSLVNILAGRRIVPEIIPWHGRQARLTNMVMEVTDELGYLEEARRDLLAVTNSLRMPPGRTASDNVSQIAAQMLAGK